MTQPSTHRKGPKKHHSFLTGLTIGLLVIIAGLLFVLHMPNLKLQILRPKVPETHRTSSSSEPTLPTFKQLMGTRLTSQRYPVLGAICIPQTGVNLPIFKGDTDTLMNFGAGTVSDPETMGQGNYSLASHHVFVIAGAAGYLFSPLTKATVGMDIYTTDETNLFTYKITSITQVQDTDLSVLKPVKGKPVITLIYCLTLEGPIRVIVRGTLVSKTSFTQTTKAIQSAFSGPWNQIPNAQLPEVGIPAN
ncbi:MAG: class A sortase [Streptococcaceae bacterium]|jgi:LPXTG-site transpeptidase (sortase) family protein|nr:class A sortase [Streptococcaceae bacterium]